MKILTFCYKFDISPILRVNVKLSKHIKLITLQNVKPLPLARQLYLLLNDFNEIIKNYLINCNLIALIKFKEVNIYRYEDDCELERAWGEMKITLWKENVDL